MPQKQTHGTATHRPNIAINMAMSVDGKIAAAGSRFSRFGSKHDEAMLYQRRSRADAIMSGATTISQERATLTLNPSNHPPRSGQTPQGPFRILVTAVGSLPVSAPFFSSPAPPILILTTQSIPKRQLDAYGNLAAGLHQSQHSKIHWRDALHWLYQTWKIRRLLCEGGGQLNQTLLKEEVVDEIYLTICPFLIGGTQAPTIADGDAFSNLSLASSWSIVSRKQKATETFLHLTKK